jgi:hypothetical protein
MYLRLMSVLCCSEARDKSKTTLMYLFNRLIFLFLFRCARVVAAE